jgi:undecaprenyl-diphosphatase
MARLHARERPGTRSWLGVHRLDRRELEWLLVGLGACVMVWIFLSLAGEVTHGETLAFDERILKALRNPADPSLPIGPPWAESVLLDLTAIGSPTVLALVVFAVTGFLLLQARFWTALFVLVTVASGEIVSSALKDVFSRPRPTVVPHLREVFSSSFPSGHAMTSAIVYLTLGSMMMRVSEQRLTKIYCFVMALLLTMLAGISRVFLGVHYPTDVIGGWIIGFVWASICWLVAQHFEVRSGINAERAKSDQREAS